MGYADPSLAFIFLVRSQVSAGSVPSVFRSVRCIAGHPRGWIRGSLAGVCMSRVVGRVVSQQHISSDMFFVQAESLKTHGEDICMEVKRVSQRRGPGANVQ